MDLPKDLRYSASHEWVRQEEDGSVLVGLTSHAQEALGEIVFLELPKVGDVCRQDDACGVVESVKAASDINAPVSGEITEVNQALAEEPGAINERPFQAWLFRMRPSNASEVESLLSPEDYARTID